MGAVSQEPALFGRSIAENIRYGKEDATDKEVEDIAKNANAYEFITKLKDGFKTDVGESGSQLSGEAFAAKSHPLSLSTERKMDTCMYISAL